MRVFLFLILIALFSACQGVAPAPKPDKLIDIPTMENIIYDVTIINSARGFNIQKFTKTGVNPKEYVFDKYKIDSTVYAQNTLYYSSSINGYKGIIERVKKRIAAEHTVLDSLFKEEKRVEDSIRNARGIRLREDIEGVKSNGISSRDMHPHPKR